MYVALAHWPCLDKNGDEVATAITNLDIHDLARLCLTYGVDTLYIVHPYQSQRDFARKIMDHWLNGFGGEYNPIRKRAFEIVKLVPDIETVKKETGAFMVGTTAKKLESAMSWQKVKEQEQDVCLVFGTGWGLKAEALDSLDAVAEPIEGRGEWNHLSVRSAVSIAIDRVLGR